MEGSSGVKEGLRWNNKPFGSCQLHSFLEQPSFFPVSIIKILCMYLTLESLLDCKEIQPVHSEGDQP